MITVITKSSSETKKLAGLLAETIRNGGNKRTMVLALEGNLGSGKTTFVQGFARSFGVKERVVSPTFILMKVYSLSRRLKFRRLVHLDCYRLDSYKELLYLGFQELFKDRDVIILIEWADRVRKNIPKDAIWVKFKYRSPQTRTVNF